MIKYRGVEIASPTRDHQVASISDMKDGIFYPTGCFDAYLLPRGRRLSEALGQDPASPTPAKISNSKCYTRAQIVDYLSGYSDGEIALSHELERRRFMLAEQFNKRLAEETLKLRAKFSKPVEITDAQFIALDLYHEAITNMQGKVFFVQDESGVLRRWTPIEPVGNDILYEEYR